MHPHGDIQWRKADGTTGEYEGPLVELGLGIPRVMRDHGIRRALYDLAFGYASGFPVRDIIPFVIRSLFPQRTIPTVEAVPIDDPAVDVLPGWVIVSCDRCPTQATGRPGDRIEHAAGGAHVYYPAPYEVS